MTTYGRGGGVAAYFGPGVYSLNSSITVPGGDYTVLGNGFNTQFVWDSRAHATPAMVHVKPTSDGLRLEQLNLISAGGALELDTKLLHDGGSSTEVTACKTCTSCTQPVLRLLDRCPRPLMPCNLQTRLMQRRPALPQHMMVFTPQGQVAGATSLLMDSRSRVCEVVIHAT